ncbi:Sensor protein FixL [Labeo rohita]|uniref:Sensor protein FixL n=1 Tax=Labeo rohita TaxID=84645 RepID=A0ABQ8MYG5_LABRO|nr:Sensor protein FixL [Labeo rohita]
MLDSNPRLQLYTSESNYHDGKPVTWYGPEFDEANRVIPIRIKGFDASLQLYTKDGKACARLYIKKTFRNWKDVFYNSWVGFYKRSQHKNTDYYNYKDAVDFALIDSTTRENYDIYQSNSSLTIAPGVQIRFLLDGKYDKVLAQTTPWESDENVTSVCDKGNHQPDPSSIWSFPEFFYEPVYYDANNVIPTKTLGYDAGLQLFTQDGYACARLYIKKTFKDWEDTFKSSWVGFYTSSQDTNKGYYTYENFSKFEKMESGSKNFDIYQYKSKLTIASGVQIRFLKDNGYDEKLAETEPWS